MTYGADEQSAQTGEQEMRCHRSGVAGGVIAGLLLTVGCASSSRTSVRYYEYDSRPHPSQRKSPQEQMKEYERSSKDWEMTSPGEMVVDPTRD